MLGSSHEYLKFCELVKRRIQIGPPCGRTQQDPRDRECQFGLFFLPKYGSVASFLLKLDNCSTKRLSGKANLFQIGPNVETSEFTVSLDLSRKIISSQPGTEVDMHETVVSLLSSFDYCDQSLRLTC